MSADYTTKSTPVGEDKKPRGNSEQQPGDENHPHGVQAQRDKEISQMQQRSRHQQASIAPDMPPAPPRTALMIVGVVLLILIVAGVLTLISHVTS